MTMAKIAALSWSVFLHTANCRPTWRHQTTLFSKQKQFLGDKRFLSEEELKKTVLKWLRIVSTQFYTDGMNKLLLCYQKCIDWNRD